MSKSRKRMLSAEAEGNMMGMSEEAVWSTGVRNELEKWKLENEIGQITSDEKLNYRSKQKELRQLKDDITLMIAEGFVYKTHCFGKYDPFKTPTERENFTWSDSTEAKTTKNQITSCSLPSIFKNKTDHVKKADRDDFDSDQEVLDLSSRNVRFHDTLMHMRPKAHSIQNHKPLNSKEKEKVHPLRKSKSEVDCLKPEEKFYNSDISTPRSEIYEYESEPDDEKESGGKSQNVASLASSLHGLVMWRQRARERHEAEQEIERKAQKAKERNQKRFLPKSVPNTCPPEFKAMFPGNCKTYYAMKKFVHKEAERMISQSDSPMYEKKRQRLHMLMQRASIPQFIHRDRTTSAILRDFKTYKSKGNLDTLHNNR